MLDLSFLVSLQGNPQESLGALVKKYPYPDVKGTGNVFSCPLFPLPFTSNQTEKCPKRHMSMPRARQTIGSVIHTKQSPYSCFKNGLFSTHTLF